MSPSTSIPTSAAHLDLPLEIWLEIFRYATYLPKTRTIAPVDPFVPERAPSHPFGINTLVLSMRTKYCLALVCRSWRWVALEFLYEYLPLRSLRIANNIFRTLESSSLRTGRMRCFGNFVRYIDVYTSARGTSENPHYFQAISKICHLCPNLLVLNGSWTCSPPSSFYESIVDSYGNQLEELRWEDQNLSSKPVFYLLEVLSHFRALRVLDIRLYGERLLNLTPLQCAKPVLPLLHHLQVSSLPASLILTTHLKLPSLKCVLFESLQSVRSVERELQDFLSAHGTNIVHLEVMSSPNATKPINIARFLRSGVCPNLQDLVFDKAEPVFRCPLDPHPSLRRIGLRGVTIDRLYPIKRGHVQNHLMLFSLHNFPRLEMVRTLGLLVERCNDHSAGETFVWWAERFGREGIDFQDGEGVVWQHEDDPEEVEETTLEGGDWRVKRMDYLFKMNYPPEENFYVRDEN